jgi:NAD(P)-dependent dehydrogenase (short-subunit alcohol dehydrogenase family)
MGRLDGKNAVVTGAGRGLGRAYARALAAEGAAVVVNDVNEEGAANVAHEIQAAGGRAHANSDSVDAWDGARGIVQACVDTFGQIDVLVNNAGILRDRTLIKMDESDFDAVIGVHLKGTFACSHFAAQRFREQGSGCIINITSTSGLCGNVGQTNYAAAKAGILGMTRTWAMELARYNVRVNALAPTAVTEMVLSIPGMQDLDPGHLPDELRERYMGAPEEAAPVVVFLASDTAARVNGQVWALGGDRLALWSHPREVHHELKRGGWDVAAVEEAFRSTFSSMLQPVGLWPTEAAPLS